MSWLNLPLVYLCSYTSILFLFPQDLGRVEIELNNIHLNPYPYTILVYSSYVQLWLHKFVFLICPYSYLDSGILDMNADTGSVSMYPEILSHCLMLPCPWHCSLAICF